MADSKISTGVQVAALFLAGAAILFGIAAAWSVLHPGPSGEWIGVVVFAAYAVNVPVGLATLGIGLFVKRGAARLRSACVSVSLMVLALPVLAHLMLWWRNHRA